MIDTLATPELAKNSRFFSEPLGWDEQIDLLSDCFCGGVTEHAFRAFVPARDEAVQGLSNDGVVGRLDNSCKISALAVTPFTVADVASDLRSSCDPSLGVTHGRDAQRDVD